MKRQISVSTAILLTLVALLTGGLVMSYNQHHVPVFVSTAQAANYEQGPMVSFAPVVKRAAPAVVNIYLQNCQNAGFANESRHV